MITFRDPPDPFSAVKDVIGHLISENLLFNVSSIDFFCIFS